MVNSLYRVFTNLVSPGADRGKLQIFIFHRVLDAPDPLAPSEPDVVLFDQIVSTIAKMFNVIALDDAIVALKKGTLPRRAATITFDDGYVDNLTNALPLLRKYNLPATVFIATDFIGGGMMWNDVVIESIRGWHEPITIDELGLRSVQCASNDQKSALLKTIIPKIKYLAPAERAELVSSVEEMTGYKRQPFMMSKEQIVAMRDAGVTIGAHTCSHPILALLSDEYARREISGSREILEGLLKDKVRLFAYPNGRPGVDYSERDVALVKELGFAGAVSTRKGIAVRNDNVFELPRFTPWDQGMGMFMLRNIMETAKFG